MVPDEVREAHRAGRLLYPEIDLPLETFAAFAAARADSWRGAADETGDLYLACACATGLPAAVAKFGTRFGDKIRAYLGRLATSEDLVDEVTQIVTVRCLVGDEGKPPAIAGYSGRGSLEGWVRATAVREALAQARGGARHDELSTGSRLEEAVALADRELALIKAAYREPVTRAFATAAAALARDQRALLNLHYVTGLTTAHLATVYRTSRATIIRRLAEAREALVAGVGAALRASDGVDARDFESVLRLVKSQVDLRLSTLLRD